MKELKLTDIVLGLKKQGEISPTFLGNLIDKVLSKCATTTFIYRPSQPLSTISRYIVIIPPNAEKEIGFPYWLVRLWNISKNSGDKMVFYANSIMIGILNEIQKKQSIDLEFHEFSDWDDFLIISRDIKENDALIIVASRKNYPSYTRNMLSLPSYLNKYFSDTSYILIFPIQIGIGEQEVGTLKNIPNRDVNEGFEELVNIMTRLFRKSK
ncbi:MAG: hypothetical protein LIO65_07335 [Odoribacter sp.]|nr:hypothetical protein [Odoribacter sp.]